MRQMKTFGKEMRKKKQMSTESITMMRSVAIETHCRKSHATMIVWIRMETV
ncbi:hypothetical protein [Blautia producta]|uniref:hypothetical protein n=1 Tax=Blautia producta TaxID=33035 RepID=UPI003983F22D